MAERVGAGWGYGLGASLTGASSRWAIAAAAMRLPTPSLRSKWVTWTLAVFSLM